MHDCEVEEKKGISLPRLKLMQRKSVTEPLLILFNSETKPLIKFIKIQNKDADDWMITEGILARVSLLIRKSIGTSLRIPISNTKKKRVSNPCSADFKKKKKKKKRDQGIIIFIFKNNQSTHIQKYVVTTSRISEGTIYHTFILMLN